MARASVLFSADINDSRIAHWLVVVRGVGEGRVQQSVAAQRLGMSVRKFKRNPDGSDSTAPKKMLPCGRC